MELICNDGNKFGVLAEATDFRSGGVVLFKTRNKPPQ